MCQPSRLPVTISGAPSPIPKPPTASIQLIISSWALTEYKASFGLSISLNYILINIYKTMLWSD